MIPSYSLAVLVTVTVLINSCCVLSTHFNSSSVPKWNTDSHVRVNNNVGIRNSFNGGGDDSVDRRVDANLSGNLANFSPPPSPSPTSSSHSITPSFSYQFHTNDHEHLDKIVLAHHNSVRNSFSDGVPPAAAGVEGIPTDNDVSSSVATRENVENKRNEDDRGKVNGKDLPASVTLNTNNNLSPTFDLSAFQAQQQLPASNAHQVKGNWQGKRQYQQQQPWHYHNQTNIAANLNRNTYQHKNKAQLGTHQHSATVYSNRNNNNKPFASQSSRFKSSNATHQQIPSDRFVQTKIESRMDTPSTVIYSSRPSSNAYYGSQYHQGNIQQMQTSTTHSSVPSHFNTMMHSSTAFPPNQGIPKQKGSQTQGASLKKKKKKSGKRKILTSRADAADDEEEEDEEEDVDEESNYQNYYHHDHRQGLFNTDNNEVAGQEEADQEEEEDDEYSSYFPQDGGVPQFKDIPAPGDPGAPPGFPPGVGPPGPFPPPPPPLKGTVDYILIPLILIGIAGPIFVVLYVILGGFEYKLAPIARSLTGYSMEDYQPYLDSLTSSVGRALEKYECFEYTSCQMRRFYKQLGFSSATTSTIEQTLNAVTPEEYGPTVKRVFSDLVQPRRKSKKCSAYQCSGVVEYFL